MCANLDEHRPYIINVNALYLKQNVFKSIWNGSQPDIEWPLTKLNLLLLCSTSCQCSPSAIQGADMLSHNMYNIYLHYVKYIIHITNVVSSSTNCLL